MLHDPDAWQDTLDREDRAYERSDHRPCGHPDHTCICRPVRRLALVQAGEVIDFPTFTTAATPGFPPDIAA